jgi:hypothetical protein
METIFKEGDRVYHIQYGWGEVTGTLDSGLGSLVKAKFKFGNKTITFIMDGKLKNLLSFQQYTLEGFSEQRPEELPKRGDVVWVRDDPDFHWEVSMFLEYDTNEPDGPYIVSPNMIEGDHECWRYLTTKNPYANE